MNEALSIYRLGSDGHVHVRIESAGAASLRAHHRHVVRYADARAARDRLHRAQHLRRRRHRAGGDPGGRLERRRDTGHDADWTAASEGRLESG